jgi:uncharacterized protein (TIGR02466 family)
MTVTAYFPTFIYNSKVRDINTIQNECKIVLDEIENLNTYGRAPWFTDNTHTISDPTFNSNHIEKMKSMNEEVIYHTKQFIKIINPAFPKKFKVTNSWFTKTEKGQYAMQHDHNPSDISGVYYVNTNGKDGNIQFLSKETKNVFIPINFTWVEYVPKIGNILLWPSDLSHRVSENKTDNTRISFSFNISFDRF